MPTLTRLLHASFIVANTEDALRFYRDTLGLKVLGERPELGYPGAWLAVGAQQLHLLELPNPDPSKGRPGHVGRDRHVAFAITDLAGLRHALEQAQIPYTLSRSGRQALFCRDPDGNGLEFIQE